MRECNLMRSLDLVSLNNGYAEMGGLKTDWPWQRYALFCRVKS